MVKKVIVCQTGARHRYLIPQILERRGLLYRLYTDSTRYSWLGKIGRLLSAMGIRKSSIQKLLKRDPQISKSQLYTTDVLWLKKVFLKILKKDSLQLRFLHYTGFSKKCIEWGVGDADCIYNMYFENFDYLKLAKSKGLIIIVDIYESPLRVEEIEKEICEHEEYSTFSEISQANQYSKDVRLYYMEQLLRLADYYTIPSVYVFNALQHYKNFNESKVKFLPYASSIRIKRYNYNPVKHRLIWVGNDPIGKGLIYCAKALNILIDRYPDIDFRVIGNVDDSFKAMSIFEKMHFIGVVPKEDLIREYESAEAYVFPSIGEGLAGTLIEAASCGCPIITTDCSGANVNEFPALFIPLRDVQAIVERVVLLFENQKVRDNLSRDVYEYSKVYSPERYRNDLVDLFKSV